MIKSTRDVVAKWKVLEAVSGKFLLQIEIIHFLGGEGDSALITVTDGECYCVGQNERLGIESSVPCLIEDLTDVTQFSSGMYHVLALTKKEEVYAWGDNDCGELGTGDKNSSYSPTLVPGLENIISISCQGYTSFAVDRDGSVYAWGSNNSKCGIIAPSCILSPQKINLPAPVKTITCGCFHTAALTQCGKVYCWGCNNYGQVGSGRAALYELPALVEEVPPIVDISCGSNHTLALSEDGRVYVWGRNPPDAFFPLKIHHFKSVVRILSVWRYDLKLAETASGEIYTWGNLCCDTKSVVTPELMEGKVSVIDALVDKQTPSIYFSESTTLSDEAEVKNLNEGVEETRKELASDIPPNSNTPQISVPKIIHIEEEVIKDEATREEIQDDVDDDDEPKTGSDPLDRDTDKLDVKINTPVIQINNVTTLLKSSKSSSKLDERRAKELREKVAGNRAVRWEMKGAGLCKSNSSSYVDGDVKQLREEVEAARREMKHAIELFNKSSKLLNTSSNLVEDEAKQLREEVEAARKELKYSIEPLSTGRSRVEGEVKQMREEMQAARMEQKDAIAILKSSSNVVEGTVKQLRQEMDEARKELKDTIAPLSQPKLSPNSSLVEKKDKRKREGGRIKSEGTDESPPHEVQSYLLESERKQMREDVEFLRGELEHVITIFHKSGIIHAREKTEELRKQLADTAELFNKSLVLVDYEVNMLREEVENLRREVKAVRIHTPMKVASTLHSVGSNHFDSEVRHLREVVEATRKELRNAIELVIETPRLRYTASKPMDPLPPVGYTDLIQGIISGVILAFLLELVLGVPEPVTISDAGIIFSLCLGIVVAGMMWYSRRH